MKKYKIIYADPPWRYERSKVQGAAEKHYPTISVEELCALPVKEIADKDCILCICSTKHRATGKSLQSSLTFRSSK